MLLRDISLFFIDSLNPVSVSGVNASVFFAGRAPAGGGLGCSTSSGRRMAPTPVRRRSAAQEAPAGGKPLGGQEAAGQGDQHEGPEDGQMQDRQEELP